MTLRNRARTALWNDDERRLRTPWRLLAASGILAAAIAIGLLAFSLGVGALDLGAAFLDGLGPFVALVVVAVFVTAALGVVARYVDRRRVTDYGLGIDRRWWVDCAFGLALGAALQTGIFLVGWAVGWFRVTGLFVADASFLPAFAGLAALFLAVGIYEELLVRGWLLTNLSEGLRFAGEGVAVGAAVLLTSGLFGALHATNPGASPLSTATISLAGVVLAAGYVLTGELAIPIGVHVTWNFFMGPVYGLGVSGIDVPASIVDSEPAGPDLVTGGAFGPEAGLLGAVALVLGATAIVWWVRRRDDAVRIHPRLTSPDLRT